MVRRPFSWLGRIFTHPWVGVACFGAWLLGQLARDASWLTGMLFYVPSLVVALVVLENARRFLSRRRGLALALSVLAIPPLWVTAAVENQWRPPVSTTRVSATQPAGRFGLVHWNVLNGWLGWDRIRKVLSDLDADVVVLSEMPVGMSEARLASDWGDGYQALVHDHLGVVSRGTLDEAAVLAHGSLQIVEVRWRFRGEALRLFVVDSASDLLMPRDPNLRELVRWMAERRPDVVVGDFNAPRRSRALWPPPSGFVHAYEASGFGWSYTWPSPLPLLAIDQCLLGPRIEPRRFELRTSWLSDHRLQKLRFDVTP